MSPPKTEHFLWQVAEEEIKDPNTRGIDHHTITCLTMEGTTEQGMQVTFGSSEQPLADRQCGNVDLNPIEIKGTEF